MNFIQFQETRKLRLPLLKPKFLLIIHRKVFFISIFMVDVRKILVKSTFGYIVIKTNTTNRYSTYRRLYVTRKRIVINDNLFFSINQHNNKMYYCVCIVYVLPHNMSIKLYNTTVYYNTAFLALHNFATFNEFCTTYSMRLIYFFSSIYMKNNNNK